MFQRTILRALAAAAGTAALLVLKKILEDRRDSENYGDDDEVRFIRITDDDEDVMYDASGKSEEVQQICAIYPYLNPDFVEEMLAKNEEFNSRYEPETLLSITHTALFADSRKAESFSEIMDAAGYICVDKSDLSVAATKKLFSEAGAVLSDILNVANQAAALNGKYEGYEISC